MALSKLRKRATEASKPAKEAEPEADETEDEDDELAELERQLAARKAAKAKKTKVVEAEVVKDDDEEAEDEDTEDEDEDQADDTENEEAEAEEEPVKKTKAKAGKPLALAKLGSFGELVAKGNSGGAGALAAFAEIDDQSSFEPLFWGSLIKGGDAGGNWDYSDKCPAELQEDLPVGRKPVFCFVIGYRTEIVAWKVDYEDRKPGEGPAWSCAIPASDIASVKLAAKACKNYQFTKKDNKDAFDWDDGQGPGRPVPVVEVLVWHPDCGFITMQCQQHYDATARTNKNILRSLCDEEGNFQPQPVKIEIDAKSFSANGNNWKTYAMSFSPELSKGKAILEGFKEYVSSLDGEIQAKYEEWMTGADNPLTDDKRERLEIAAKL